MTAVFVELECGTCGQAFIASSADFEPGDYWIRGGELVAHDCPGCRGERKEPTMTTETSIIDTLANELEAALAGELNAWADLERQRVQMPTFLANVELRVRREATEAGEKLTEGAITARIVSTPAVLEARQRELELEWLYRSARARVTVAETRISLTKAGLYAHAGRVA